MALYNLKNKDGSTIVIDVTNEPFVIDQMNIHILIDLRDRKKFDIVFNSSTHWTRITVIEGAKYNKDTILKIILSRWMEHYNEIIFPVLYQNDGSNSFFLLRNCFIFLRKLGMQRLKITHPCGTISHDLTITANYLAFSDEPLDINRQIKTALSKRGSYEKLTFDLSNFANDECLEDIFVDMSNPVHLSFILDVLRTLVSVSNVHTLVLQHNNIRTLENVDLFKFKSLQELDLRYNNLQWEGFEKLNVKIIPTIKTIWLDGNPLCIDLSLKEFNESDFIKRVESVIPLVRKIDGIDVSNFFINQIALRNFIYHGSWSFFVDHFLHHYFGLMEGPNRPQLARMYHQKATLTISTTNNSDVKQNWNSLANYNCHARNLLTLSDVTKAYSTLKTGPDEIISVLNSLPVIQFDPDSFTVDVPLSQVNGLVLIDVGGIFQEMNSGLFYFHRSFMLTPFKKNPGEWKIENDMFTISPATSDQIRKSFATVRRCPSQEIQSQLSSSITDKDALIPIFCDLTKLTQEYATRFLKEGSWDLERTLQAFIDQFKSNQIPMYAFSI